MLHQPSAPAVRRSPALLPRLSPKRRSSWKGHWSQQQTVQSPDAGSLVRKTCFSFSKKQLPSYTCCCHLASFTVRHFIPLHSYKDLFERWERPPPQHSSTVSPTQAASCPLIAVIVTQGEHWEHTALLFLPPPEEENKPRLFSDGVPDCFCFKAISYKLWCML